MHTIRGGLTFLRGIIHGRERTPILQPVGVRVVWDDGAWRSDGAPSDRR